MEGVLTMRSHTAAFDKSRVSPLLSCRALLTLAALRVDSPVVARFTLAIGTRCPLEALMLA